MYRQCRAGAQIIFPESGRGLGHVTPTILAVRSAILATAWLLVGIRRSERNGRACQSSLASCSRAHPLQNRRIYRAVNDRALVYMLSYFPRIADVSSRLRLRSSTSDQLIVLLLPYNLATVGKRAFPVSDANVWDSLPAHLTSAPSLTISELLKTNLLAKKIMSQGGIGRSSW